MVNNDNPWKDRGSNTMSVLRVEGMTSQHSHLQGACPMALAEQLSCGGALTMATATEEMQCEEVMECEFKASLLLK